MKTIALLLSLILSISIKAQDLIAEEVLPNSIVLSQGQNYFINLNKSYFINHIVVAAEGIVQDTMLEVLVDGKVKGTIYAPGRDPLYVVTIREVSNKIELRYLSGARARISSVRVFRSENGFDPIGGWLPASKYEVANFANQVISLSKNFEVVIPTVEFNNYLLPTKVAAGQLYAVAGAHGDSSMKTMEKFQALYLTMTMATSYIDRLLMEPKTFEMAVKFLEMKERMRDMLDI